LLVNALSNLVCSLLYLPPPEQELVLVEQALLLEQELLLLLLSDPHDEKLPPGSETAMHTLVLHWPVEPPQPPLKESDDAS
jgi:hypothetical protein